MVLVVDDSLTVRKISGRLLARHGYHVLTAKDGVDALEHGMRRGTTRSFGVLLVGMITGVDGSGFAGLPLTGALSGALAPVSGADAATLAARLPHYGRYGWLALGRDGSVEARGGWNVPTPAVPVRIVGAP